VKEIPISVTAFFRLPFSWIWFRNFGLKYAKICTRLSLINSDYINLYFHPWDFVDLRDFKGKISPFILKNAGRRFSRMFEDYIGYCKRINLKSKTVSEYINETF
jgi:hypothetical protein